MGRDISFLDRINRIDLFFHSHFPVITQKNLRHHDRRQQQNLVIFKKGY